MPLLSAALLVLVCVLWARSRRHSSILGFFTPAGHLQAIASDRGGVLIFLSDVPFGPEARLSADFMSMTAEDFQQTHALLYDATKSSKTWHFAGFNFAKDQLNPTPTIAWHYRAMIVPYWLLVLLLAWLPLRRLQRWSLQHRRIRRGQCPACGYDLRHSAGRCPECGVAVTALAGSPTSISAASGESGMSRGIR